jgi:hypothetical protein
MGAFSFSSPDNSHAAWTSRGGAALGIYHSTLKRLCPAITTLALEHSSNFRISSTRRATSPEFTYSGIKKFIGQIELRDF